MWELLKLYRPLAVSLMILSMLIINYWLIEIWRWQRLQEGEQLWQKWQTIRQAQPNSQIVNVYLEQLGKILGK